jgi:hypothetical protein
MSHTPSSFLNAVEPISKYATLASKFGVLIGALCVFAYSLRIGYFPQDTSIGDGFLILVTGACFGMIYIFLIACLLYLGIFVSPAIHRVFNAIHWLLERIQKKERKVLHGWPPYQWFSVMPAIFAIFLIYLFGQKDQMAYWQLPSLSFIFYIFYAVYVSCEEKLKHLNKTDKAAIQIDSLAVQGLAGDRNYLKRTQYTCCLVIFFVPVVISGIFGELLDAAMRTANVRLENVTLYVKEPYSSLIPESLKTQTQKIPKDYIAFEKTTVLFKGFGKNTVISFPDQKANRKLEIPNEFLIVESLK